jgi:hypothetical protein
VRDLDKFFGELISYIQDEDCHEPALYEMLESAYSTIIMPSSENNAVIVESGNSCYNIIEGAYNRNT